MAKTCVQSHLVIICMIITLIKHIYGFNNFQTYTWKLDEEMMFKIRTAKRGNFYSEIFNNMWYLNIHCEDSWIGVYLMLDKFPHLVNEMEVKFTIDFWHQKAEHNVYFNHDHKGWGSLRMAETSNLQFNAHVTETTIAIALTVLNRFDENGNKIDNAMLSSFQELNQNVLKMNQQISLLTTQISLLTEQLDLLGNKCIEKETCSNMEVKAGNQ
eukprot:49132_1